ncbi:hypothetical protein B0O80DRAFT_431838 [Mortierella sp. GBAus27b]|nr:hypothetical protein B0O80DRAFT_431838 [Mortierella sp. GBAus27b]
MDSGGHSSSFPESKAAPHCLTLHREPIHSTRHRHEELTHSTPFRKAGGLLLVKQYAWKPWQGRLDPPSYSTPPQSKSNTDPEPTKPRDMGEMSKQSLTNAMQWEHPIRTLSIGTLNANLKRVLSERPSLRNTVKSCIQDVVHQASITKRA